MARRVRGQLIEALLEGLEDACMGVDRSGRIRFINTAMCELFGIDPELDQDKFWDIMPVTDFTRTLSNLVNEADPNPYEQVVVLPEDKVYVAQILPCVTPEGRYQGAVSLLKDMAAVQKIEQGLDQFLVDVNAQLKTPLTAIKGYVETLLEGAYSNAEITRRFLQVINDETNRLARLVVSLEEAAGGVPESRTTSAELVPIVRSAAEMFRGVAAEKNLSLELDLPAGLPFVEVDPEAIRKAMVNLIDNAVKCTGLKGYGTVKVAVRAVPEAVEVTVSDTGVGIPEDEQEKVFEQYYRVQKGPAAELGGTGLGLFVVKEVVTKHSGALAVSSIPGKGAAFTIRLPR